MTDRPVTLVTGASSGIGAELARLFAPEGARLVLTARRTERLESLAAELQSRHGAAAEVIGCDLAAADGPARLVEEIGRRGLTVGTLVNNAGFGLRGRFDRLPAERQLEMVALNITAPTALARAFLPGMIARREGRILNVASLAAFQAGPNMAVYYASKAYLLSLSEALHEEAAPHGVTVTALCPGPVDTEFSSIADAEGTRLFRAGAMQPGPVAQAGYEGLRAGKAIVVPGAVSSLFAIGARVGGRTLSRKIARRLNHLTQG